MAVRRLDLIITSNATAAVRGFLSLADATKAAEKRFGTFGAVAAQATAAAVVGAGALAIKATQAYLDFDDAMTQSLAIMGEISGPMRKRMEDAAKAVATRTTFSATEAASAYYELASAGLSAEQSVEALGLVATFAQAGQIDLAKASELLTTSQAALGLKMEDPIKNMENMTRVADVLTEINNLAAGSVEDFATALTNKAAAALQTTGKDLEEGVAVLGLFAERGITGATAGEKLSIALRDIPRAAARNADEFKRFGIEVFDSSGNLKNMADIVAEFEVALGPMSDAEKAAALESLGLTRSVGDIIRQMLGGSDRIREFEAALRGAGGTTQEVADKQMESLRNKLEVLGNKFNNFLITLGEPIAVWLVDVFLPWLEDRFIPKVEELAGIVKRELEPAFGGMADALAKPAVKDALAAMAEFAAGLAAVGGSVVGIGLAMKPVMAILGGLGKVFGVIGSVIGVLLHPLQALTGVWQFLAARLAFLTPILGAIKAAVLAVAGALGLSVGVFVAVVAAIIAAGVAIFIFRDEIWKALQIAGRAIADFAGMVWDKITGAFSAVVSWFQQQGFGEALSGVWRAVTDAFSSISGEVVETIATIRQYWDAAWRWFDTPVKFVMRRIIGAVMGLVGSIGPTLVNLFNAAVSAVRGFIPAVMSIVKGAVAFIKSVWENVAPVFVNAFRRGWNLVSGVFQGAVGMIKNFVGLIMNIFQGDWGQAWDNIKGIFSAGWQTILTLVRGAIGSLKTFFQELPSAIFRVARDIFPHLLDIGKNIVLGIVNGLVSGAQFMWNQAKNLFNMLVNFVKGILGISSPSSVFAEIGRFIVEGLLGGIISFFSTIFGWLSTAFGVILNVLRTAVMGWGIIFQAAFSVIATVVSAVWNGVVMPVFRVLASIITGVVVPAITLLWNIFTTAFSIIGGVIQTVWTSVIQPVINTMASVFMAVVPAALNILGSIFRTIWTGITTVISWAWNSIIQPVWSAIQIYITQGLMPVLQALWTVAQAVWNGITTAISWAWTILVPIFNFLWTTIQTVWNLISTAISAAWTFIRDNIFQPIWNFIQMTLVPVFQGFWTVITNVWEGIRTAINNAWTWIRDNIFGPIQTFVTETIPNAFTTMKDALVGIWEGVRNFATSIWDKIMGAIKGPVNSVIGFINKLIDGVNAVLDLIPGLKNINIPRIPELGGSGGNPGGFDNILARGGTTASDVGPFVTKKPTVLVGEGNSAFPEFVIPTDPRHRGRALALYNQLGQMLPTPMGIGGIIGSIGDAIGAGAGWVKDQIGRATGAVTGLFRKGLTAVFSPVNEEVKRLLDGLPNVLYIPDIAQGIRQTVWDWVRGADQELPEEPNPNSYGPPGGPGKVGRGVEQWRAIALEALALAGQSPMWINDLLKQMMHESGGNPRAINLTDSNAARGTPSKGLMQTIDSTFNAYAGHLRSRGVWDPLANIFAAINYTVSRYGSLGAWRARGFKGYASGGIVGPLGGFVHPREMVLTPADQRDLLDGIRSNEAPARGRGTVVHIHEGAVVIKLPSGATEAQASRLGGAAAKRFIAVLEEHELETEARLS